MLIFLFLRIIVGVKYCFRYNQRNRRPQHDENGEPIDMVTMPHGGHGQRRRRREKKLMSMDEVNERFPLLKYKAWMTNRAEEGLPTAGGVAAPTASRAASLRNAEGTLGRDSGETQRPITPATKGSLEQQGQSPASRREHEQRNLSDAQDPAISQNDATEKDNKDTNTSSLTPAKMNDTTDDMDDDDQIQMAVPTEMMAHPGDSCAICIDTLEDDDDVRGLTCGHAFHASCLDPWLTSRRACCPLCKADYYVPKPRPEGEGAGEGDRQNGRRGHGSRSDLPNTPENAFQGNGQRRPRFLPARFMFLGDNTRARGATNHRQSRRNRDSPAAPSTPPATTPNAQPEVTGRSLIPHFSMPRPNIRLPAFMRRNQQPAPSAPPNDATTESPATAGTTTTPSQLEAGQR